MMTMRGGIHQLQHIGTPDSTQGTDVDLRRATQHASFVTESLPRPVCFRNTAAASASSASIRSLL
jgi:hypothetical protein